MKFMFGISLLMFSVVAAADDVVNINRANAATLDQELAGIGPAKAKAIVAERKHHGPYKSADDLTRVKGIGPKLIEKNRAKIVVADSDEFSQ